MTISPIAKENQKLRDLLREIAAYAREAGHDWMSLAEADALLAAPPAPDDAARRLRGLRDLCGYVENATDTSVRIFQDDATRTWFVAIGPNNSSQSYHHSTMELALDRAIEANKQEAG